MAKRICGIYRLTFSSGKTYIGSSRHIMRRFAGHIQAMRSGTHENRVVQRAYAKYGEPCHSVILVCREADLLFYEQLCLDTYAPEYNMAKRAGEPSAEAHELARLAKLGKPKSDETRKKISQTLMSRPLSPDHPMRQTGKSHSPETIAKMRGRPAWNKGVPCSDEKKEKLRLANIGKRHSAEAIANMSGKTPWNKGVPCSDALKEQLRFANLGKTHSEASKEKLRIASTGKRHSPEDIDRMREIKREWWRQRKEAASDRGTGVC